MRGYKEIAKICYVYMYINAKQIIKEYKSGQRISRLAKKYGVSVGAMRKFLKMKNVKLRKDAPGFKSVLWNIKDEVIKEYKSGKTLLALADKYDISHTAIARFLRKNGIKLRRRGNKRDKKECGNEITREELVRYANLIKAVSYTHLTLPTNREV